MTSRESFDGNAFEVDNIRIEISNPNQRIFPTRVYPIPKNQLGIDTPVKLNVCIINNTSKSFRLNPNQSFIPELLTSDGQAVQRQIATDDPVATTQPNRTPEHPETREVTRWEVKPGVTATICRTARLSWRNNLLQLQVPTIPGSFYSSVSQNNCWCFDALQPGTYQLRFIFNIDPDTTPIKKSDTREVTTAQQTGSNLLVTPWLNLHLVQPVSTDSSAIEVDGVQFKTEMPETVLTIPFRLPGFKTSIKLGIRATNNTSTALRFEQLDSLDLNLIAPNGKEIQLNSDLMRLWVGKGSNYYLAQPGESTFFVLDGTLDWSFNQLLQLAFPNKAGGFYYFRDLKPGTYQFQLIYHVSELKATRIQEKVLEKVWTGWIAMPFVELNLV